MPERLTPRIKDTARGLWFIYVGLSAVEVVALVAAGMPLYESFTHTFGTMATEASRHSATRSPPMTRGRSSSSSPSS